MREGITLSVLVVLVVGCGVDAEIAPELTDFPPARDAILEFEAPDPEDQGSEERAWHDGASPVPWQEGWRW